MANAQASDPLKLLKSVGAIVVVVAVLLSLSFCSEIPKYRFEKVAEATGEQIPGGRLIGVQKTGDLASPITWIRPEKTTWTWAIPDPIMSGRFTLITLSYDDKQPTTFLIDADCKERTIYWYALGEPESSPPALNLWGDEVKVQAGTYRHFEGPKTLPKEEMHQLCDTDWAKEREAFAKAEKR